MKLSFARKEDETTAFSSTEPSSSSSPPPSPHALAIGICDVAGAGVRALKSLTTGGNFGGNQLQKRDFDLKFTGDDGEGLIWHFTGLKDPPKFLIRGKETVE